MFRLAPLLLLLVSFTASAIVIRDDVDASKYRVPPSELPALADLPGEGHGVLIAPRWVLTAAHAVSWQMSVDQVTLKGVPRAVQRLVIYPGYQKLPQALVDKALKDHDIGPVHAFLAATDDVALIELKQPVTDVAPMALYTGSDELGKIFKIVGKGSIGTGATGQDEQCGHRTELRRAFNRITGADGRWLSYSFHRPPDALPLEGLTGDGDSGTPLLIQVGDQWQAAGLASWKDIKDASWKAGLYGQTNYNVRVSHYLGWITSVTSEPASSASAGSR